MKISPHFAFVFSFASLSQLCDFDDEPIMKVWFVNGEGIRVSYENGHGFTKVIVKLVEEDAEGLALPVMLKI